MVAGAKRSEGKEGCTGDAHKIFRAGKLFCTGRYRAIHMNQSPWICRLGQHKRVDLMWTRDLIAGQWIHTDSPTVTKAEANNKIKAGQEYENPFCSIFLQTYCKNTHLKTYTGVYVCVVCVHVQQNFSILLKLMMQFSVSLSIYQARWTFFTWSP